VGGGRGGFDGQLYGRQNTVGIFDHVAIPESQNAIALTDKVRSPHLVNGIVGVLPTVKLNDELELVAREITEIAADGRLSAEVMDLERRLTQMMPEYFLDIGRIATKPARAPNTFIDRTWLWTRHSPHPNPSPPLASLAGGGAKNCPSDQHSASGMPRHMPRAHRIASLAATADYGHAGRHC
jgi:hypothetical protein